MAGLIVSGFRKYGLMIVKQTSKTLTSPRKCTAYDLHQQTYNGSGSRSDKYDHN